MKTTQLVFGIAISACAFVHSAPVTAAPVTLEWVTTVPMSDDGDPISVNKISAVTARLTILDSALVSAGTLTQTNGNFSFTPPSNAVFGDLIWDTLGATGLRSGWAGTVNLSDSQLCPALLLPDGTEFFPASFRRPSVSVNLFRDPTIAPNAFSGSVRVSPLNGCGSISKPPPYTVSFLTGANGGFTMVTEFFGVGGTSRGYSPAGYWSLVSEAANVPLPSSIGLFGIGLFALFQGRKNQRNS